MCWAAIFTAVESEIRRESLGALSQNATDCDFKVWSSGKDGGGKLKDGREKTAVNCIPPAVCVAGCVRFEELRLAGMRDVPVDVCVVPRVSGRMRRRTSVGLIFPRRM